MNIPKLTQLASEISSAYEYSYGHDRFCEILPDVLVFIIVMVSAYFMSEIVSNIGYLSERIPDKWFNKIRNLGMI